MWQSEKNTHGALESSCGLEVSERSSSEMEIRLMCRTTVFTSSEEEQAAWLPRCHFDLDWRCSHPRRPASRWQSCTLFLILTPGFALILIIMQILSILFFGPDAVCILSCSLIPLTLYFTSPHVASTVGDSAQPQSAKCVPSFYWLLSILIREERDVQSSEVRDKGKHPSAVEKVSEQPCAALQPVLLFVCPRRSLCTHCWFFWGDLLNRRVCVVSLVLSVSRRLQPAVQCPTRYVIGKYYHQLGDDTHSSSDLVTSEDPSCSSHYHFNKTI